MGVRLGNGNWAVKTNNLLAYNDASGMFFNKEFDFTRATTATRVNKSGLIESVATNLPRIDFTDDTKGHLLLEPASTNLALNSNDLTNSSWSKFNATATTSTVVNPEGTSGASLYICGNFTGTNQYFRIDPNTTYTSDASFTYSMFVKYNTFQFCRLTYVNFQAQEHFTAVFDIVNGIVTATHSAGTPQNTSSKIENFGNGWFRISISAAISSSSGNQMNFEFNKSPSGTPTFKTFARTEQTTTTNDKVYVYGVQLEQQSFATSYIPTLGSSVTRNAEVCNNSGAAQDFNTTEGVLYAEIAAIANDQTFKGISISDSSSTNEVLIRTFHTDPNVYNARITANSSVESTMTNVVSDITQFNKIALKYKSGDIGFFVNGVKVVSATSTFTFNSNLNQLRFEDGGGSGDFYGKAREVRAYTTALTDAELIALTT